jgi:hypothetical protein
MRLRHLVAAALTALSLTAWVPSATASDRGGGPRSLAVSVPPEPTPIEPGARGSIPVRVVNPGARQVTVTIAGRGVELGDNGAVRMAPGPDPQWNGLVSIPEGRVSVAARSYVDVPITVRMPADAPPDLYFVGFLVTPEPGSSGDVQVVNQIGSFVTVDVPGPRDRRLEAELLLPGLSFGRRATGSIEVENVGPASVQFWGETGTAPEDRLDRMLLPAGRTRSIEVHTSSPRYLVGFVTTTARLVHPGRTDAQTLEILLTDRTFVISPLVFLALAPVLLVVLWWRVSPYERARRAKSRAMRGRHTEALARARDRKQRPTIDA